MQSIDFGKYSTFLSIGKEKFFSINGTKIIKEHMGKKSLTPTSTLLKKKKKTYRAYHKPKFKTKTKN